MAWKLAPPVSWTNLWLCCNILALALALVGQATSIGQGYHEPLHLERQTYGCTSDSMKVRREWGTLTRDERLDFINSVKCLMNNPSRLPSGRARGAINHYDDFVATHLNKTLLIHGNGIFLTWHRHFVWLFEQAMQKQCGYAGSIPYWNWPLYNANLSASPIFDGSDTSLSGDGVYDPDWHGAVNGDVVLPKGNGGGCVVTGPFAYQISHFRAFTTADIMLTALPPNSLDFAPHCLRRDLNSAMARNNTNQRLVTSSLQAPSIEVFQERFDGLRTNSTVLKPHAGGHWSVGPGMLDVFASPSDPTFWLHHSMVDLVYSTWQAKDPSSRYEALSGGSTSYNRPPSPNVTLDFLQDWGFLGKPRAIRELMNIGEGPYCYRYDY